MSNNTVEQFAAELRRPVADLLKQLQEAGVSKTSGSDSITSDDKKLLLAYLKKSHGSESGTISIGRKKAEVSTVAGVQVETRRRARTVVVPSTDALAAEAKAKAEQEAAEKAAAEAAERARAEQEAAAKAAAEAVKAEAEAAASQSAAQPEAAAEKPSEAPKAAPKKPAPQAAAPTPVVNAAEQALRDEEARRAAALRAHQEALLKEKQDRQARREAVKLQAQQEAQAAKEAKNSEAPRSAKPSEKKPLAATGTGSAAAANAGNNAVPAPARAKKTRAQQP